MFGRTIWMAAVCLAAVWAGAVKGQDEAPPAAASASAPAATEPSVPRSAGFESPRAAMFAFLEAMTRVHDGQDEAWPQVLGALDLSRLGGDAAEGQRAAEALLGVLDRLGEVRPAELPDADQARRENLGRFRYFPRYPEHSWVRQALGKKEPNGRIILERDPAGGWRFSAGTVAGAAALLESMKELAPRYEGDRNQVLDLLGPTFERTPGWGWVSLLAAIFVGVVLGKVAQGVFRGVSQRLGTRGWEVRATVFENAAGPLSLAILTLGLTLGLRFIHLEDSVAELMTSVIKFLYILTFAWFLYNLVDVIDLALRRLTEKTESKLDDMLVPLIRKTLRIFLVIVFSLVIAQNVFGLNITGWLAGLGIAGLAVSLAAQDSIKNLFGSITVFFDKPFVVGDLVKFDGRDGVVEEIGFRSTKMRTLDGFLVTVPNMKFIDGTVENVTVRPAVRRVLDVTITYDTPADKIEEAVHILRDLLARSEVAAPFDLEKLPPRVAFNDFNAASLNIRVFYWYTLRDGRDYWSYLAHAQDFNLKLFRAFAAAGIEFAFPTQTLYLAGDPKRELSVRGSPEPASR